MRLVLRDLRDARDLTKCRTRPMRSRQGWQDFSPKEESGFELERCRNGPPRSPVESNGRWKQGGAEKAS